MATLTKAPKGWDFSYPKLKFLGAFLLLIITAHKEIEYAKISDSKWNASANIAIELAKSPPKI